MSRPITIPCLPDRSDLRISANGGYVPDGWSPESANWSGESYDSEDESYPSSHDEGETFAVPSHLEGVRWGEVSQYRRGAGAVCRPTKDGSVITTDPSAAAITRRPLASPPSSQSALTAQIKKTQASDAHPTTEVHSSKVGASASYRTNSWLNNGLNRTESADRIVGFRRDPGHISSGIYSTSNIPSTVPQVLRPRRSRGRCLRSPVMSGINGTDAEKWSMRILSGQLQDPKAERRELLIVQSPLSQTVDPAPPGHEDAYDVVGHAF